MKIFNPNTGQVKEYSAGFLVFSEFDGERRYLILKYPGGHFDFAKGHLEQGENNLEAAHRELTEETGISEIEVIPGFEEKITYNFRRGRTPVKKTVTFFLGRTSQQEVKISHEHHDAFWMNFNDALAKVTFDNAKNILSKAEEFCLKQ
ncbi:MAG: bis(5'-nucleosyl)-tetraphosphatase [Candidatus Altimarinota bacterium]